MSRANRSVDVSEERPPPQETPPSSRLRSRPAAGERLSRALLTEWRELGWVGRVALIGILLSLVIAVTLGFTIPAAAKRHLLAAETEMMESVAAGFVQQGLLTPQFADPAALAQFDEQVRLRLLGGETVRVKVWTPGGTVAYSDAGELVGQRFPLTRPAREALEGIPSYEVSDLSDPAHALDRDMDQLIEFYIPIVDENGTVIGAFEIEQRVDSLATTLGHIQRNVWFSIAIGIGVLAVFMGSLTLAGARAINRRRRQAESLLGESLRAREAERRRIVGALHGDIGQPLYRLLYRLEGLRSRADNNEVAGELAGLGEMVRDIDRTLRAELTLLHHSEVEDVGLGPALTELIETTRAETGLDVDIDFELPDRLGKPADSALFWAAEEALINARKHARAARVAVSLKSQDAIAILEVTDDGVGVSAPEGLGLTTIRERLDAIGGGLSVEARRGGGTVFRAWVPLREASEP
jgi:signal transduction histidine kinase